MTTLIEDQSDEILDAGVDDVTALKDDLLGLEAEIISQFDADEEDTEWIVNIYEAGKKGEKDGWLFDCSPSDISGVREKLLNTYGTGTYRARVRKGNRLHRFLTYRIVAPRITDPATVVVNDALTMAVQGQQVILERMLTKISETPQLPVQNNPLEMIDIMSRLMSSMREMTPAAPVAPAIDPMQMFELIFKGMEMGKENSGGGDSNVIDLIRDVLKGVDLGSMLKPPQIAGAVPGQRLAPPVPAPTPTGGAPASPGVASDIPVSENAAPEPTQEIDPVVSGIVGHLAQFIPHSRRGADPALYADVILDNAPRDAIKHVVNYPDIETIFQASNPAIAENWPWFDMLLNELRDALAEPSQPDFNEGLGVPDLTSAPEDDTGDISGEEIQGQTVPADQATDVSKPNEQPTPSGSNGHPERSGRDESDAARHGDTDKGGKEKPGSKDKGG